MKLVDVKTLFPEGKGLNAVYWKIPQPMFIFHSQEEFSIYLAECINNKEAVNVVRGSGEYMEFLQKNSIDTTYNSASRYLDLSSYNLWIKTIDEFVPEYTEENGTVFYAKRDDQFIPTDGCYIKVYYLTPTPSRHVLYTSSGIHSVGMTKWDMTAGVRKSFLHEKDERQGKDKELVYQQQLQKIVQKRKTTIQFITAAQMLFNPVTDYFMDIDKTFKKVFGSKIKSSDYEKLTHSKGFQMAIQQTLKNIFPGLAKAIKEKHTPEMMAGYLSTAMGVAQEEQSVDKILKVFEKIQEVGYGEVEITTNNVPMLPPVNQSAIGEFNTANEITVSKTVEDAAKALEQVKKDLDYPDSFVMSAEDLQ